MLPLLWVVACGPPPDPCGNSGTGGFGGSFGFADAGGSGELPPIGASGKPFEVTLTQFRFSTCGMVRLLAAVQAGLPKAFHGGSWDAFTTGMMAEAKRFLVGVEALCRASIAV